MNNKIIIGTRSSTLALWQANFIKTRINTKFPEIEVVIEHVSTKGDKILDVALSKIDSKGLFTKELEIRLLEGSIDIAVHSLKDLQTEIPAGLTLASVTERHSPEDVLVAKTKINSLDEIPQNAKIATGSLRRKAQLLFIRPDLQIQDLRGNVETRLKKLDDSDWLAIVLARAGLERLALEERISYILPYNLMLPAVGQGALGIEISQSNDYVFSIVNQLEDNCTRLSVDCERAFLKELGGGCQNPIAANANVNGELIEIDGLIANEDGSLLFRDKLMGPLHKNIEIGKELAQKLIKVSSGNLDLI